MYIAFMKEDLNVFHGLKVEYIDGILYSSSLYQVHFDDFVMDNIVYFYWRAQTNVQGGVQYEHILT